MLTSGLHDTMQYAALIIKIPSQEVRGPNDGFTNSQQGSNLLHNNTTGLWLVVVTL